MHFQQDVTSWLEGLVSLSHLLNITFLQIFGERDCKLTSAASGFRRPFCHTNTWSCGKPSTRSMTKRWCLQRFPFSASGQVHFGCWPMVTVYTGQPQEVTSPGSNPCRAAGKNGQVQASPFPVAPRTTKCSEGPSSSSGGAKTLRSNRYKRWPEPG